MVRETRLRLDDICELIWALGPYVFGALCVGVALRARSRQRAVQRRLGGSLVLLHGVLVGVLAGLWILEGGMWSRHEHLIFGGVLAGLGYHLYRGLFKGPGAELSARWLLGVMLLAYVLLRYFMVFVDPLAGAWMAICGLLLCALATVVEARIRSRRTTLSTLARLLTARLRLTDLDGPNCFECGYPLIGLVSRRCPECGLEFDPASRGLEQAAEQTPT